MVGQVKSRGVALFGLPAMLVAGIVALGAGTNAGVCAGARAGPAAAAAADPAGVVDAAAAVDAADAVGTADVVDAAGAMDAADAVGAMDAAGAVMATGMKQAADPLAGYTTHIVATHFLRGREYQTHHYFKGLREGVLQGLVFREAAAGVPLIEVEWAIAPAVYDALPEWQKAYWHPLFPAVDAGRVSLPDLPAAEEREMLETVSGLYAQTINLAGLDGELPVGVQGIALATHLTAAEMRDRRP